MDKKVQAFHNDLAVSGEVLELFANMMRAEMEIVALYGSGPRPWEGRFTNAVSSPPDCPDIFGPFPTAHKNHSGDIESAYSLGIRRPSFNVTRFGRKIDWSKPLAYPQGTREEG